VGGGPFFPERSVWLGLKNASMYGSSAKSAVNAITVPRSMCRVELRSLNLTSFAGERENAPYIKSGENNLETADMEFGVGLAV
jgi:hypothetical protein